MKAILRYKGGSGSGNFGHEGRPGEIGGSGEGGGDNKVDPYLGKDFNTIVREVIGNEMQPGTGITNANRHLWKPSKDNQSVEMFIPGGKLEVRKTFNTAVAGKFVASTTSQQRYDARVELVAYKTNTAKTTGYSLSATMKLWGKIVKSENQDVAKKNMKKFYDEYTAGIK